VFGAAAVVLAALLGAAVGCSVFGAAGKRFGLCGQVGAALLGLLTGAVGGVWLRRQGTSMLVEAAHSGRARLAIRWLGAVGVVLAAPLYGAFWGGVGLVLGMFWELWRSVVTGHDPGFPDCTFIIWGQVGFYLGTGACLTAGLCLFFRRKGRAALLLATALLTLGATVWLIEDLGKYEPRSLHFLEKHVGLAVGKPH
jgi:hypothetical protein